MTPTLREICEQIQEEYNKFDAEGASDYDFPENADRLASALLVMEKALTNIKDSKAKYYDTFEEQATENARDALTRAEEIMAGRDG